MAALITPLGRKTLGVLRTLGHHAFFFVDLLRACRRRCAGPYLAIAQVHCDRQLLAA